MAKYLNSTGLSYVFGKIKDWVTDNFAAKNHTHPALPEAVVQQVTTHSSQSISAQSNSYKTGTATKSGYYPIGIVGSYTSDFRCPIAYASLSSRASGSAGWVVQIGNWSSSARTVNANIKILWVKEVT